MNMESIETILPPVLLETADKMIKFQQEESKKRSQRFRSNVRRIVGGRIRDMYSGMVLVAVIVLGAVFLRGNKNGA